MGIHRGVKFPKSPPPPQASNPFILLILLALVLLACFIVANWNRVTSFMLK